MKSGQFTCLSFLSPNESPAFLLLLTEFFQSQLLTTLVHQKLSLRGSRKHPLLSPIVFLPVCLLNTPPSRFTWTLRASSGQGRSLAMSGASSCSGLSAPQSWAAPTEPGPVGRMMLSCTGKGLERIFRHWKPLTIHPTERWVLVPSEGLSGKPVAFKKGLTSCFL